MNEENDVPRKAPTQCEKYEILKRQEWRCNMCGKLLRMSGEKSEEMFPGREVSHFDHIWPYSQRHTYPRGAENINEINNFQGLCEKCNLSKSKKVIQ